jgi:hypothetical protein
MFWATASGSLSSGHPC